MLVGVADDGDPSLLRNHYLLETPSPPSADDIEQARVSIYDPPTVQNHPYYTGHHTAVSLDEDRTASDSDLGVQRSHDGRDEILRASAYETSVSTSPTVATLAPRRTASRSTLPNAHVLANAPPAASAMSNVLGASTAPAPSTHLQASLRNPSVNRFAQQQTPPYTANPPLQVHNLIASTTSSTKIYAGQLNGTPVHNAQPPLGPAGVQISVMEIMTYNPNWVLLPPVAMRLGCNGYRPEDLASMFLRTRRPSTPADHSRAVTRIKKQLSEAGKLYLSQASGTRIVSDKVQRDLGPQDDSTALTWETRGAYPGSIQSAEFVHVKLSSFYSHLSGGPDGLLTGSDALSLTKCLRFASENPLLDLDTSQFDWIMHMLASAPSQQHNGLYAPAPPVAGSRYDAAALKKSRKRSG
ncbi:hypothetical protein LTR53_000532 [Teratosphaeriaceae sp. CCFEE 6253]|nr:hypothetical protein LTR53_000532 [Teratosphaeriaceae sp. CCFEE 6253]